MSNLLCSTCKTGRIHELRSCLHGVRMAVVMGICLAVGTGGVSGAGIARAQQAAVPTPGVQGLDRELLATLSSRIAELTPDKVVETELVPGQMRLLGCDVPDVGLANLRQASHFELTLYLECLPGMPGKFKREVLVILGDLYVAREPLLIEAEPPGAIVKRTVRAYVPRNAPAGTNDVKVGIVRKGAVGAGGESLTSKMAALFSARVTLAGPPTEISDAEKRTLMKEAGVRRDSPNLITNGGFESGSSGWVFPKNIFWKHSASVEIDKATALEGSGSARIDFSGGGDPNFWDVRQRVQVKPNTRYRLSYFVKAENVTSASGLGMCVADPQLPTAKFWHTVPRNERARGTTPWTHRHLEFTTPQKTERISVQIRRWGGGHKSYDRAKSGPIGGSAWYDMIQLIEVQEPGPQ